MSNVTQEMLDESLKSCQEYLDSVSDEEFIADYLKVKYDNVSPPAAELIGYNTSYDAYINDFLNILEDDIDSGKISVIPDSVWERVDVIKGKAAEAKKRKEESWYD